MRITTDSVIQCPFFRKETKNLLCCEGFIEGTCMTTAFIDRGAALNYISANCSRMDGGGCPLAMNLFEKYKKIREAEEAAEREWKEKLLRVRGLQHRGDNFIHSHMEIS